MGVIRVMQIRKGRVDISDLNVQRREGMRKLGDDIINIGATSANDHARDLAAALKALIDTTSAEDDAFQVYYDAGGGQAEIRLTDAEQVGSSANVRCSHEAGGAPVMLMTRLDSDNGNSRQMDVVFPHPNVRNDYAYLAEAAADIREFPLSGVPIEAGQQYLATFKLLSRCK